MRQLEITPQNETCKKANRRKQEVTLDLMGHIEKIVDHAKDSKLSADFYRTVKIHSDYVGKTLELTPVQSVLISLFINNSDNQRIELKELSRIVNCSNVAMIRMMNDIDILVEKKYIRARQNDNTCQFCVPSDFIEAVRKETPYVPTQYTNLDKDSLFITIEKLIKLRDDGECSYRTIIDDLSYIIEQNQHLEFCKKARPYHHDSDNFLILITFCSLLVNDDDDMVGFHDFIDLLGDKRSQMVTKRDMGRGEHPLMKNGSNTIEFTNDGGFENHEYFKLTSKAKEELLSDYKLKNVEVKPVRDFLTHTTIAPKELYYNASETLQINKLEKLLQNNYFQNIQTRLSDSGMRKGFACLFYGSPGTGKTETAYQIARKTERDIMVVNVSEIKSCWVGESEKNIKALFDRYREYVRSYEVAPILLFNEADAIIGIRQEAAQRGVDKMENSIQNIILQEMETLDGIMIATTNLTQNLDKAFERRFLYKIEFSRPTLEAKQSIWKSIMSLSDADAEELASSYDFSGGQIENIARKRTVDVIIGGVEPTLETLHSYCRSELLYKATERQRIGFRI